MYPPRLSAPLSSFVGREDETAALIGTLHVSRLVTLIGTGGIGKSRLALAVGTAYAATGACPDGAVFLDLSAAAEPALLPCLLARAVQARVRGESAAATSADRLYATLRAKTMLVIIDHCDKAAEYVGRFLNPLLAACPGLHVLATSSAPLEAADEKVWPVPGLRMPAELTAGSGPRAESVQLFLDRASAARPDLQLTPHTVAAASRICRRLNGVPMAIEVVAAGAARQPIELLASQVDQWRRRAGSAGTTDLSGREIVATILARAIDGLREQERVLLRRITVLAGGWTIAEAEAVAAGSGIATAEVAELIGSLVNSALVVLEEPAGPNGDARYRLPETVRRIGQARLHSAGEMTEVRRRHRVYYRRLAAQLAANQTEPDGDDLIDRLSSSLPNLRVTMAYADDDLLGQQQRLATAADLLPVWQTRGSQEEGLFWLSGDLTSSYPSVLAARVHSVRGALLASIGSYEASARALDEAQTLFADTGDQNGITEVVGRKADLRRRIGDRAGAMVAAREHLRLTRTTASAAAVVLALETVCRLASETGEYAVAAALLDEMSGGLRKQAGAQNVVLLYHRAYFMAELGHLDAAEALYEQCLQILAESGDRYLQALTLGGQANAALRRGDQRQAKRCFEEAASICAELPHNTYPLFWVLVGQGRLACIEGELEFGVATLGHARSIADDHDLAPEQALVRNALATACLLQGRPFEGVAILREGMGLAVALGNRPILAESLVVFAAFSAALDAAVQGATALGAAAAMRSASGTVSGPLEIDQITAARAALEGVLGLQTFAEHYAAGMLLSPREAVDQLTGNDQVFVPA